MKKPSTALAKPAKKAGKTQTALPLTGESTGPDWSRARFLADRIKHAYRLSLAGQILLGHELETIKIELGFCGRGGDRRSKPHDAVLKSLNRTWDQHCKSELGMSCDTADRLIGTYEAGKSKLKRLGGQPHLLKLLDTPPEKLDQEGRNTLSELVDKVEWGESQKQLLEDFKLVKVQKATTGGDTSQGKKTPAQLNNEQLAFAFFGKAAASATKLEKVVGNILAAPDYDGFLECLPLHRAEPGGMSLHILKLTLEAALGGDLAKLLGDVNARIAAKEKADTKAA